MPDPVNMNEHVGRADVILITIDSLRFDVAESCFRAGRTPNLAALLPGGWERRHTPGSFTLSAHAAFLAGFFPTPVTPGRHPRPFALRFPGSETTDASTAVFDAPDLVAGFRGRGYRSICLGGVGFFTGKPPLGNVFTKLFDDFHWSPETGVTSTDSTRRLAELAARELDRSPQPLLLFMNLPATHQPTTIFLPGAERESVETQAAALAALDDQLPPLLKALARRERPRLGFIFADHGTAFGEDGHLGHRVAHPIVWEVPYAEFHRLRGGPA
jgi:hypothetical protein